MLSEYPNPTLTDGPQAGRRIARYLIRIAYLAAPIIAALAALLVSVNAGATIARLMARLGADPIGQALAGAATVGVLALLLAVALLGAHTPTRALSLIYLVAWLPLTVALSAAEAALGSGLQVGALATIGQTLATLLSGLALLPAVTLAVASRRADGGDLRAELAHYLSNAQKLVLLAATAGASVAFGLSRGMPAEVSAFVAVVLEVSFLLALTRARTHWLHAGALAAFGCVLSLVSVETISALAGLRTLAALAVLGEIAYQLTPAAGLAYIVSAQLVQPGERTRTRPVQPEREQADQVADGLPVAEVSLNGKAHDPK